MVIQNQLVLPELSYPVYQVEIPYASFSILSHKFFDDVSAECVLVCRNPEKNSYSCRSKNTGYALDYARRFPEGGGHPNAAGFTLPKEEPKK
jgi:nanoRNase/pAp phosphatase (c-di-AMP/oligoRNAs hydrolase)